MVSIDAPGGSAPTLDPEAELRLLSALCDAARPIALKHFRGARLAAENKAGDGAFDPVTQADREIERTLRALLCEARPEDGVFGEEYGARPGPSGRLWVIDPIDGTRAFMSGLPTWGVLIALYEGEPGRGRCLLGALDQPYLGERFIGAAPGGGFGARGRAEMRRAGDGAETTRPLRARRCESLADATLFTTDPELFAEGAERQAFEALRAEVRLTRYGADCYGYAMVAAGHADIVLEAGLSAYDLQALVPLLEGAGGALTDWRGGARPWDGRALALGDPGLASAVLPLLAGAAAP
ncbi:MAG: inositol monophosphatase family protein [Pseudomonadota bacterium]